MSAERAAARTRPDPPLLDEEAWEVPQRISESDLSDHVCAGWRRVGRQPEDPESDP